MDPEVAVDQHAAFEPSQNVGKKKRGIQNGDVSASKKQRCRGGLKRVAEIVLVLSAMGKMRGGGKSPTSAEMALIAEARETLAVMCEEVAAPNDIVGSEAIGNAIEELGLNSKLKEHRLGYRGMGMSISQKVLLAKMKMKEPKKFSAPATYASQSSLQTNAGGLAENRGPSHAGRILSSDRSIHATVSSGGIPFSSPPAHVTPAGSTPLEQFPTSDVKMPTMSTGMPSGHLGRDSSTFAYPRVDRPQIKLDGGSNVPSYVSQVPANSSASHPLVNAPTWSLQAQSAALAKPGQENKALTHNPIKVEGSSGSTMAQMTPQEARDQTFRPFVTQTATGTFPSVHQPVQGVNFTQAPPFNNHNEIARIVQNLLQPKLPAHPTWTPPSREYMNKALTCQTCKLTINEVETVLICDACEKGFHLKCLQLNNKKGIPRGEWHCARCLSFCNGKPLPPKYGRVMRSINVPKVLSSTAEAQSSSEKKVENLGPTVNHEKVAANGSSGLQTPAVASTVDSNPVESASASMVPKGNLAKNLEGDSPSLGTVNEIREEHFQITESTNHEERKDPALTSQFADISYNTISNKANESQPSHEEHSQMTESSNHEEIKDPTSTSQLADTSYNTISNELDDSQPSHEEHSEMTESSNHEERKDPTPTSQLADTSYNTISNKVDDSQPSHEEHSQMTESSTDEEIKDPTSTSQLADTSYNTISNKVNDSQPSHEEHSQMTESFNHEERKDPTITSQLADTSYNTISMVDDSQLSHDSQGTLTEQQNCAEVPSNNFHDESSGVKDLWKGCSKGDIDCIKQSNLSEQEAVAAQVDPTGNSGVNTAISRHPEFSSDGLRAVEWAGDVLQIVDGKKFYQSCCIDGMNYKVHDHALVHSGQDKLIPSKLQAMWEDAKTGSKWVVVERCYFPSDLPEGVAHPCAPEIREVYESNNDSTVMASSIQCPCEVLPADKFREESERRSQLGIEANEGLRAIFLCRWLYDEFKGSFQPISS